MSIGCSADTAIAFAQYWQTGIDHRSAISASAANPAAVPAPRWATISGRSASASRRAARTISSAPASAPTVAGRIRGGTASASGGHGSHSTSRGRLRYTGPFGVLIAIAYARSISSGTCSGNRTS